MLLYHLRLLIEKSLRYAWRRRVCRCCPKIIFELIIPAIFILLLCLLRWIHTPSSKTNNQSLLFNDVKPTHIRITPPSIIIQRDSIQFFNYTSVYRCPSPNITIEIVDSSLLHRFTRLCPRSSFILSSFQQSNGHLLLNTSLPTHCISYRCRYDNQYWCQNTSLLNKYQDTLQLQHPSSSLCSNLIVHEYNQLIKSYLAIESLLNPPVKKHQLSILTWPCSSYASDVMFEVAPGFTFIIILIFIDGCILFSFNLLFQSLIDEKHQGITELLRLLSIRPLLNSLAWFLRVFTIQLIVSVFLILILKISFDGGIYLSYVSMWFIIPTIVLWTIQVLSRSVLIAHFFNSTLKAALWSWFIYLISFWLAVSSSIRLPIFLHLILSAWLPFYSIKRIFILFIQINTDLGRRTHLTAEIIYIWLCIITGIVLMWLLAFYLERIRPGKYGISRPWSWPLDYVRQKRIHKRNRRNSVNMHLDETPSDEQTTVRISNLTKTYGRQNTERHVAVDHISFELQNSTIYGLIGHNGCGKTSTMEMICGLLSSDCGTIEIRNKNLSKNLHELQSSIGYCPQQDMLFSHLTVQEQLEFYARVRSKGHRINHIQIEELLAMLDMKKYSERLCHTLSGGMQRKLSILCAFVGEATVILLDEPSSSLDPVARRILWSWLREHKANRTLLISSHLLDEVEELCDSVIILDSGKVQAQGTVLELKRQFGPLGDRLRLDVIPSYIPKEWIIDEINHYIQIPNRKELIQILEQLEQDNIRYSLINVTLDDIFIQLNSSAESSSQEENTMKSQIDTLFAARTSNHLWAQQTLGVLIRRGQVFLRRARLLPIVVVLYLIYALAPIYMPSLSPSFGSSSIKIRYIVSSAPQFKDKLNLKNFGSTFAPSFNSSHEFQQYLLGISTWPSNHYRPKTLVGLRIVSLDHLECYIPSPILSNIITSCLPIFSSFSNRTISPLRLINRGERNPLLLSSSETMFQHDSIYYCFYTLPPTLHLSVILLSLILIICAALAIQDNVSGLHSYSLIHGLHSPIHWCMTFLSDLILCLIWLLILVLIARFVHSSTFNSRFFLLTPLFFITNLPFIYLMAKGFKVPVLGATVIIFILQLAHVLYTFKVLIELFRAYRALSTLIHSLRWLLLLIFPNVNVFTLIVAILRQTTCPLDDITLQREGDEFSHEHYPYKILIHTFIFIAQFILYFILLIMVDILKIRFFGGKMKGGINQNEDNDVTEERDRIESMNNEDRQNEAIIVDNLSKQFPGSAIPAVNRLTFAVPHRQCFGLLGFNGSGKTTTFRMLIRELQPSSGYVYRNNKESIGYCPQDDISFSALTVIQSINYICRLHGFKPISLNNLILTQFQLERYRDYLISNLSGGTRRRLHLALCLIGSPTLLLLDEPTAKVDPLLRRHIRVILQHRPIDTSIIFASHSMLECEQLCDRLTILVRGNAQCLGSLDHLKTKYGTDYRIRLRLLQPSYEITFLARVDNSNEYTYPVGSLAHLFTELEELVEQNIIESNYTVQLTSLEDIFLTFQHSSEIKV